MVNRADRTVDTLAPGYSRRRVLKSAAAGAGALTAAPMLGWARGARAQAVTLKILVPQGALADGLLKMAPKFEADTGNSIEVAAFPYVDLQQKTITLTQVQSDEFDMFFVDDPWMPNLKPATSAVPLDTEYGYERDPDIFEVSYDVFSWPPPYGPVPESVREQGLEQHQYGVPVVGNVILFAIREDVLEEKGLDIPETWDDALAIAEVVYDPDAPFYGWTARQAGGNVDSIPILWSLGGDLLDDEFNVILDNEAGLRTFNMVNDLAKFGPKGLVTYQTNEFAADFLAGRAMMGLTWPGDTLVIMEDPAQSQSAGKLHYMNSPAGDPGGTGASVLGNWGLVLNAASQNRDASFEFMAWLTSKENSIEYARNGGIPFRRSDLENPELIAQFPWYPAQAEASAAPPKWRPRTTAGGEILDMYGQAIQRMVGGEQEPEEALTQAADEIRQFMETVID